ncbi:MAG: O-methyltransferase, partial [Methylocystis sp.]|nr:O-methyltransferase [Methylocystis sp.]
MSQDQWSFVDRYISDRLVGPDAALDAALRANAAAGLPAIDVSPPQGKFLHVLARSIGARKILEVGTLGGYSTIWLARALPADGRLVTLEAEPAYAKVAAQNIARAGLSHLVDLRVGPALKTLPELQREGAGPFDLAFIDADKPNNANYFALALKLSRPGGLIVVDNVVRDGAVVDPASPDPTAQGARALFEAFEAEPRVAATA